MPPDAYTIPEMELTPEEDGRVRITMAGYVGFFVVTRRTARQLMMTLSLAYPEWLIDD